MLTVISFNTFEITQQTKIVFRCAEGGVGLITSHPVCTLKKHTTVDNKKKNNSNHNILIIFYIFVLFLLA